jgi:hypothetical protein
MVYRPINKEELFNLRHSSARNIIERIFGILKQRYRILLLAPGFNLDIQARIPASLSAIHNFIRIHNPDEGPPPGEDEAHNDPYNGFYSGTGTGNVAAAVAEAGEAAEKRNQIAQDMWDDYQRVCQERGIDEDEDLSDSEHDAMSN